ncbi:M13 family metallopeptidase [Novosphingopyxis sp. YJ-S2-01]|uniref:M13 family metallopeptidase n=1 Tax=Novosphingopyxis sp. YJ-S2-01 TaxID=2794021 RepID=UPI0018DD059D|nr:M13 family metallopeptidase [Novosphingopyxis sp. YJ-S2-01]MBH9536502.1 M13 family metallopeptidase [Novosphingopyxis sp. YJ-S2-01]
MNRRLIAALLLSATTFASLPACSMQPDKQGPKAEATTPAGTEIGIDLAGMDTKVNPGDNFYDYANGTWQKTAKIPADRSSTGVFLEVFNEAEKRNKALIEEIVQSKPMAGTDASRIAKFYHAYMDVNAINSAGMRPIQPDLQRYAAIEDKQQLSETLGANLRADVDPLNATDFQTENLFGLFVTQGLSTPGEVLPYLLQGGLGLPEREYYLSTDPDKVAIRDAYKAYIQKLLSDAGISDAAARADRIFALETKIARAHETRAQSEDFADSATIWSRGDFEKQAPGIDWNAFFSAAQLSNQLKFAAYHAPAISRLSKLVASEPLQSWKDWLVFHQINAHADVLPSTIDQDHFAFYGTQLNGTPEQQPRDKRALAAVNSYLGDAVGKLYVEKYFPASAKRQVNGMVSNIIAAFRSRVQKIDWMAPETKAEALAKIESLKVGVGYPDSWRDYAGFELSNTNAYADEIGGEMAEYRHQLSKIGQPFDKNEWWMTPQTVNAVNLPVQNALNFPAAILEPPFFDPKADAASNYGSIGAVIGHEISHSFDNNGAAFDAEGKLRDWWTEADLKRFQQQGAALANQYDAYSPFPGVNVNGKLTLGENIADVAGLQAAYDAYRASLNGKEAPVIDGFTGDQRFFIAYAQSWRTKMREEALRQRIATDGHAPGQYRALTVRNLDAWYKAFDVKPGDKLYLAPDQRVRIW